MTEFFMQGDFEKDKGLPISMLMDRKTTNIAKAQKGFIEVLVQPLWNEMLTVLQWSDRKIIDNAFAENLEFDTKNLSKRVKIVNILCKTANFSFSIVMFFNFSRPGFLRPRWRNVSERCKAAPSACLSLRQCTLRFFFKLCCKSRSRRRF